LSVTLVLGARPQIIKSAPFIHLASKDKQIHLDIIHTGQHYDYEMTKILQKQKPDIVIVPGDINSTLAGALTAAKLSIPVAHVEAGARSYDIKMPEEINRRLTDHCSTTLFTPTENCTRNLIKEGINKNKIRQTGDLMYDAIL